MEEVAWTVVHDHSKSGKSSCLLCSLSLAESLRESKKVPELFVIAHSTDGCQQYLNHISRQQFKLLICCPFLLTVSSDMFPPVSNNENSDHLCSLYYLILSCTPHHYVHREVEPPGILGILRSRTWKTIINFLEFACQLLAARNGRKSNLSKIVALQVKLEDCIAHIGSVDHVAVGKGIWENRNKNWILYWCWKALINFREHICLYIRFR